VRAAPVGWPSSRGSGRITKPVGVFADSDKMLSQFTLMSGTFLVVYLKWSGIQGLIQIVHLPSPAFGSFFQEK
jgi:hypothetical protein